MNNAVLPRVMVSVVLCVLVRGLLAALRQRTKGYPDLGRYLDTECFILATPIGEGLCQTSMGPGVFRCNLLRCASLEVHI